MLLVAVAVALVHKNDPFYVFFRHTDNPAITTQKLDAGWSQYTNTQFGISFEYPSRKIAPYEDKYTSTTSSISFSNVSRRIEEKLVANQKILSLMGIGGTITGLLDPDGPNLPGFSWKEIGSIDDWMNFKIKQLKDGPYRNMYQNLTYQTVDGEKVAIFSSDAFGSPSTNISWIQNKKVYEINIVNLSPADTERVWKSFKFLNKEN